jgi:NDP-sugar pyrophosphorylase family protein
MAGGKSKRLDPFTRILPKPLIPIGDEPIIKIIMDKFGEYNILDFYLTINDKAKMIKAFFYDHN